EPGMPRQATPRGLAAAAFVVAVACLAIPNPVTFHHNHQATITLADAHRRPGPWLTATVRLDPPDLARDANWFNVTAWQGARTAAGGPPTPPCPPSPWPGWPPRLGPAPPQRHGRRHQAEASAARRRPRPRRVLTGARRLSAPSPASP